jgi:hypothetical protein
MSAQDIAITMWYNTINTGLIQARLDARKTLNNIFLSREYPDNYITTVDIYGDIIKNVNKQAIIIYYKAKYKNLLIEIQFLTNIINKTLTSTYYERTKEQFDDMLQMLFKCFGMATHQKWSSIIMEEYYTAQKMYELAINLQSQ